MKRAIIIHAWDSAPGEHWYQKEKKLLEDKGYTVELPKMPGGRWPKLDEWLQVIEGLKPDENTVMIGHSLGLAAIFRYMEKSGQKVDKVFSIAGFAKELGIDETRNFLVEPFDWERIKENAKEFYIINEKNDPHILPKHGEEIAGATGGEFIAVEGNIHFDKMDLDLINSRL